MTHVMGDTETYAKIPGAIVLSVGLIAFDPVAGTLGASFYRNIDIDSCRAVGLVEDADTVAWWAHPDRAEAWAQMQIDQRQLRAVLAELSAWWAEVGGRQLWCQGPSFDQPILDWAYRACGMEAPWGYNSGRDTRTIYELTGEKAIAGAGTFHHALNDSTTQAEAMVRGYQKLGLSGGPPDRKPIRADLALVAAQIAAKAVNADTARGFAQTAVDFLAGTYEPLDNDDAPAVTPEAAALIAAHGLPRP